MQLTNNIVLDVVNKHGFDIAGFAPADKLEIEHQRLQEWLGKKYHSGMKYMENHSEKRKSVEEILPCAKSVISLGLNYYTGDSFSNDEGKGKISRYAWGKDYHLIIWNKLNSIIDELKTIDASFEAKSFVDTGPVMDKAWAVRAGLGWQGKHTNIINRQTGSWFFIATIITNFKFNYSMPSADFCGSCTACIDACPTEAIVEPYLLDAGRCISYLTIENKEDIPEEFKGKLDNWAFGCDICQDVCPWNERFSKESDDPEFKEIRHKELDKEKVLQMEQEEFSALFRHSPIKRSKLKGLKRNISFLKQQENC